MAIAYRVQRVERFLVIRSEQNELETTGSVRQVGKEHDGFEVAYEVAYALARAEQETLGTMQDQIVHFPSPAIEDARADAGSSLPRRDTNSPAVFEVAEEFIRNRNV